jgi:hypothetical protein
MSCSVISPALLLQLSIKSEREVPFVEIDLGYLENDIRESSADTFDGFQGEHNFAFTINVGVLNSENVCEFTSLCKNN